MLGANRPLLVALAVFFLAAFAVAQSYTVTDLGTLPGARVMRSTMRTGSIIPAKWWAGRHTQTATMDLFGVRPPASTTSIT
jgi:hypothetical protein